MILKRKVIICYVIPSPGKGGKQLFNRFNKYLFDQRKLLLYGLCDAADGPGDLFCSQVFFKKLRSVGV